MRTAMQRTLLLVLLGSCLTAMASSRPGDVCEDIDQYFDLTLDHQVALNRLGGCLASPQPVAKHRGVVAAMIRHSLAATEYDSACRYAEILAEMLESHPGEPELAQALTDGLIYCQPISFHE